MIDDYLTQLESDKDDLVTNLTTQGITGLTGDETFTELVPEVLNISGGGGGLDWSAIGYSAEPSVITDDYNYSKDIYDNWVTSTSYKNKFKLDYYLTYMPLVDTSSATDMSGMFDTCYSLKEVPLLNTQNVTNMSIMFQNCLTLVKVPQLDTSSLTNASYMFNNCKSLKNMPLLDFSTVTNVEGVCVDCANLTNFGGFKDLGEAYSTSQSATYSRYKLAFNQSTKLTHDSLMNVINNLYDIATKGCNTQGLILGNTNLAKLSADEIAIATAKGWTVS